jgi:exopolysaccharide biosynthesis polyprenyl glycosylphosphotransferase
VGRAVMRTILADPGLGYQVIGYVDDDPVRGTTPLGRFRGLGPVENLASLLKSEPVHEVIVTLPWMYHRKIMQIVDECNRHNVRVRVVPDVFQQKMQSVDLDTLNGIPLLGIEPRALSPVALIVKRGAELAGIVVTAPIWLAIFSIVALLIVIDSRGPIFFKHRRVGKDGAEFGMYKFRSMINNAEEMKATLEELNEATGPLFKIKDDPRLTRVGKFLRRTSIDELPQIINVILGEMSVIGPRPGTPEEVAQYEPWQHARNSVKPGISGLWQVSGRSEIPFEEMCLLDIYYIENWSLWLDVRIVLQTIPYVLLGHGAY